MYTTDNLVKGIFDWRDSAFPAINTETRGTITDDHLMTLVSNILIQLGIPTNVKGYTYLREAIIIKVNNGQADISITQILYPSIAKKFHTSAIRVERAIRYAIETAWNRTDPSCRDKILLYAFLQADRRPTNLAFIAMVADRIMLYY